GEPRSLEKGEDGDWNMSISLARPSSSFEIAAALFRMPQQIVRRVAAHERKLQRPARLTDDRKRDQRPLQKEADEGRAAVKGAKNREDIDPRNVIADDEI